jgi:LuxR family transcriptional regulator, maltose regulon positive regulatory protein
MNNLEKAQANRTYVRRLLRETQPEFAAALESATATFPGQPDQARRMQADLGRELGEVARGCCSPVLAAPPFARHDLDEATAALAPVRDGSVPRIDLLWAAAALLLEVIADDVPAHPDAAAPALERDLGLAEPDHVLVPALIRAALGLFKRRAGHGSADAALASLVAGLAGEVSGLAPASGERAWPGEPLTKSETRVLGYLPTHLTAPEIAAELYLSANTVKTHLRHLYEKLGVHSRQEAVQRARAIGLFTVSSHSRRHPVPRAAHDRAQPLRRRDAA